MRLSVKHSIGLVCLLLLTSCHDKDESLRPLDALINTHQAVQAQHQTRLDSMQAAYQCTQMTDEERFEYCGLLFDKYRSFNLTSQYAYAQERIDIASRLANKDYRCIAQLNRVEVLMRSGMYHEAVLCLDSIAASPIASDYQPYYFHLRRTLYGLMEDFAITEVEKKRYLRLTQDYRDSIIRVEPDGSFVGELVRADALYADGLYDEALTLLEQYESTDSILEEQVGIVAITKAQIYRALGNHEEEKRHLIISACSDMRSACREYIALRELAVMLYEEGDIDHAYRYMRTAIEDAQAGHMRGRSVEISTIYPIVEKAYLRQEATHKRMLYGLIVSIALLAGMLSLFLIYSARKRKQLASLNELLKDSNSQLQQSNRIKTVYIGRYMKMTTLSDFDDAFLELFPDFIDRVKDLLVPEAELHIKPKERLNTDLRVLALIHLGITDSKQIASFLRYSLPTIYNSRTRMRNLAKGNRDEFEQKIATL